MGVVEGDEKVEDPLELSAAMRLGQEAADHGLTRPAEEDNTGYQNLCILLYKDAICVYSPWQTPHGGVCKVLGIKQWSETEYTIFYLSYYTRPDG